MPAPCLEGQERLLARATRHRRRANPDVIGLDDIDDEKAVVGPSHQYRGGYGAGCSSAAPKDDGSDDDNNNNDYTEFSRRLGMDPLL